MKDQEHWQLKSPERLELCLFGRKNTCFCVWQDHQRRPWGFDPDRSGRSSLAGFSCRPSHCTLQVMWSSFVGIRIMCSMQGFQGVQGRAERGISWIFFCTEACHHQNYVSCRFLQDWVQENYRELVDQKEHACILPSTWAEVEKENVKCRWPGQVRAEKNIPPIFHLNLLFYDSQSLLLENQVFCKRFQCLDWPTSCTTFPNGLSTKYAPHVFIISLSHLLCTYSDAYE